MKTTSELFSLAKKLEARVILTGDRHQHGSVERGAALRLLETEAGLVPAEIKEIQRQKDQYRDAVKALSEGRVAEGFNRLDRLGWVKEFPGSGADGDRYKTLAREYVATVQEGKTAIVISPTHREAEWVTREIRSELRRTGRIGSEEREFVALANANLTQAERRDESNYQPGDVVVFHQNAKQFKKGQRVVSGKSPLPLGLADHFTTFHTGAIALSRGDVIRVTQNGKTADGKHRLNNGGIYKVKDFTRNGDIKLHNGWVIAKDYGFLAHGVAVTSHASQGNTVDKAILAQSAASFPASSKEQFYVSVSRAREQVTVYTDDKRSLLEAVSDGDERLTASELVNAREKRDKRIRRMQRTASDEQTRPEKAREMNYER